MLDEVNRATGRAWRVVRPLEGGWQGGASLIEDDDGPAVLKISKGPTMAAPLVEAARAQGYPTPAWIDHGVLADGSSFVVQELVDGNPIESLTDELLDAIFDLIALQRTIRFEGPTRDWNATARDEALGDSGTAARLVAAGGTVAEAATIAERLARPHAKAPIVGGQMVHGDFSTANLIVRGNEIVGAIDIEGIGSGCSTLDLLNVAGKDYMWGDARFGPRVLESALRAEGAATVAIGVAAQVINILAFGLDHWPIDDVHVAAESTIRQMTDLATLL